MISLIHSPSNNFTTRRFNFPLERKKLNNLPYFIRGSNTLEFAQTMLIQTSSESVHISTIFFTISYPFYLSSNLIWPHTWTRTLSGGYITSPFFFSPLFLASCNAVIASLQFHNKYGRCKCIVHHYHRFSFFIKLKLKQEAHGPHCSSEQQFLSCTEV